MNRSNGKRPWPSFLSQKLYEAFATFADSRDLQAGISLRGRVRHGWARLTEQDPSPSLVVYAPTIGEYRAVHPLIKHYCERAANARTVVLTAQEQYLDPIQALLPDAVVSLPPGPHPRRVREFMEYATPRLVVFAEGPSVHGYFPIRTDVSIPYACMMNDVPLFVVNACVYRRSLASRLDRIEHVLFAGYLHNAIYHWFTSSAQGKESLRAHGMPERKISVIGDLKIDAQWGEPPRHASKELHTFLQHLQEKGPIVVAGSVSAIDEQQAVIRGWRELRRRSPNCRLILAPRYINEAASMRTLYGYLDAEKLVYRKRSDGFAACRETDLVVLDVLGELSFYYSIASIAYAGRNHGVLEPLRYGVPTVVAPDRNWQKANSSYSLYKLMNDEHALVRIQSMDQIGKIFIELTQNPELRETYVANARAALQRHRGAVESIMEAWRNMGLV